MVKSSAVRRHEVMPEPEAPQAEATDGEAEQPSEAPGDPVAEAEAADETSESTPSEGEPGSEEG